jgi:uncharacterized protein (DUF2249 family)
MNEAPIVDVRPIPAQDRYAHILGRFDGLQPGEAVAIVSDDDPKPLLHRFQEERAGAFEWWPLEEGPTVWRVVIERRTEAGGARAVTEFLERDHRRLDALWDDYGRALAAAELEGARARFLEFATGLRRHIRMEEDLLFPAFEKGSGLRESGPTAVMRSEHREIKAHLQAIETALVQASEATEARQRLQHHPEALESLLASHGQKEEHVLYPATDRMLAKKERDELVRKMQAV